jgi:hypothetical protein
MVEALRNPQVKNFFTLELLSAGTPMLLMGDEVRRTQRSNNNAYCEEPPPALARGRAPEVQDPYTSHCRRPSRVGGG